MAASNKTHAGKKFSLLVKGKEVATSDWSNVLFEYKKNRKPTAQPFYEIINNETGLPAGTSTK